MSEAYNKQINENKSGCRKCHERKQMHGRRQSDVCATYDREVRKASLGRWHLSRELNEVRECSCDYLRESIPDGGNKYKDPEAVFCLECLRVSISRETGFLDRRMTGNKVRAVVKSQILSGLLVYGLILSGTGSQCRVGSKAWLRTQLQINAMDTLKKGGPRNK